MFIQTQQLALQIWRLWKRITVWIFLTHWIAKSPRVPVLRSFWILNESVIFVLQNCVLRSVRDLYDKTAPQVYTPLDFLAKFCKVNLPSSAKKFGLICMFSKDLFSTKPNLLWSLLNVIELLTPWKICFTLGLFSNYFSQRRGGGGGWGGWLCSKIT